jgi:hypothetical protein
LKDCKKELWDGMRVEKATKETTTVDRKPRSKVEGLQSLAR